MAKINIKFNNTEYSIDSASLADATARLEAHLTSMVNGSEVLEGDGAEYYTLAPTPLSFRSTAPLSELQEVTINGEVVDPSNYTLEEGSTIVTLPIDYLKTLATGSYEVSVVSTNKAVNGNFTVKAPELNEYGFYYNQPYTAGNTAFFIREDGTYNIIVVGLQPDTGEYTINGNNIIATHPTLGTLTCIISHDGTEIYCNESATNFVLGSEIFAADEDYLYYYSDEFGGCCVVSTIDKTKTKYADIRTGINGYSRMIINAYNFYLNTNLTSITIPDSVIGIGIEAFAGCENLTSIIFTGTMEQWGAMMYGDDWNLNVPATHVHCIDGDVAL